MSSWPAWRRNNYSKKMCPCSFGQLTIVLRQTWKTVSKSQLLNNIMSKGEDCPIIDISFIVHTFTKICNIYCGIHVRSWNWCKMIQDIVQHIVHLLWCTRLSLKQSGGLCRQQFTFPSSGLRTEPYNVSKCKFREFIPNIKSSYQMCYKKEEHSIISK